MFLARPKSLASHGRKVAAPAVRSASGNNNHAGFPPPWVDRGALQGVLHRPRRHRAGACSMRHLPADHRTGSTLASWPPAELDRSASVPKFLISRSLFAALTNG